MKYKCVQTTETHNPQGIKFNIFSCDGDRVEEETIPIMNFFYYPVTMKDREAVHKLYLHVMSNLQKRIDTIEVEIIDTRKAYETCMKELNNGSK